MQAIASPDDNRATWVVNAYATDTIGQPWIAAVDQLHVVLFKQTFEQRRHWSRTCFQCRTGQECQDSLHVPYSEDIWFYDGAQFVVLSHNKALKHKHAEILQSWQYNSQHQVVLDHMIQDLQSDKPDHKSLWSYFSSLCATRLGVYRPAGTHPASFASKYYKKLNEDLIVTAKAIVASKQDVKSQLLSMFDAYFDDIIYKIKHPKPKPRLVPKDKVVANPIKIKLKLRSVAK